MLLATLLAGCTKDEVTPAGNNGSKYVKIFVNQFNGNGSKVSFDPGDPNNPEWITNEPVWLKNGSEEPAVYYVKPFPYDPNEPEYNGMYGLWNNNISDWVSPLSNSTLSIYPGASFDDADVEVSATEIILKRLRINFLDEGRQSIAFPMVAKEDSDYDELNYDHLTAALKVSLLNEHQEGEDVNIYTLRVVAQSISTVENFSQHGVTARWKNEGPWMPGYQVGDNVEDIDVKYASVMNFDLKDVANSTDYKTLPHGDQMTFLIPLTISKLKKLELTGYGENGEVLFHVHKTFFPEDEGAQIEDIERNGMYELPLITIQ